jgi:glycosyltransferase involved in cell wall biosynthesis
MNVINYSIIIPHYNIPDLLIRCLKSIPVREDIQVIVVDDCSPDAIRYLKDYPELSRPYLEYYSTLKGGSAGRARNVGLDHAKGRWLIFLDADDLLTPDAGQILDETIDRTEDIIFYNTTCVMSDDLSKASDRNFYGHYFEEFVSNHDEIPFRYRFHSLWGKVIRRDLVISNNIRFDETRYSNDVYFSCLTGHFAQTIAVIDRPFFIVTERRGSLASSQFSEKGISLEECQVRFDVALKINLLLNKWGIKVFPFQLFEYSDKMRDNFPWVYAKNLAKLTFTQSHIAIKLVRKDIGYYYRNIFHKTTC